VPTAKAHPRNHVHAGPTRDSLETTAGATPFRRGSAPDRRVLPERRPREGRIQDVECVLRPRELDVYHRHTRNDQGVVQAAGRPNQHDGVVSALKEERGSLRTSGTTADHGSLALWLAGVMARWR